MDTHTYKASSNEEIIDKFIDGSHFSEALKLSNISNVYAARNTFLAGTEDTIDLVRAQGTFLKNIHQIPTSYKPEQFYTIKGGSNAIIVGDKFYGTPKKWDISIGDFTIYNAVSKDVGMSTVKISGLKAFDNKLNERRVKIIVIDGDLDIDTKSGDMKLDIIRIPKFVVKIYFKICSMVLSRERKEEALRQL